MKAKNLLAMALCTFMSIAVCACAEKDGPNNPPDDGDSFTAKPVDGIAPLFDEGMKYYNIQPSILYEGENTMHVYYTANQTAGGNDSAIYYRRGTLDNGEWVFGERKLSLSAGASGSWDGHSLGNCDVVKGKFLYDSKEYAYLMAYQANDNTADKCNQIGFAVAETADGNFVKVGNAPVIVYDETALGYAWGAGQPSLVNYDGGKVYLFFTIGDALATQTYVSEIDASNLNAIKGADVYSSVSTDGLIESNIYTMLNDADFGIDQDNGILYVVRNLNPASSTAPTLNTAVQVAKVTLDDLYKPNCVWEVIDEKVNFLDLATQSTGGWERVYSACICSDEYGRVNNATKLELGLTVTSWDLSSKDYTYFQTIIKYGMSLS